jgi:hypothetical protein
LIGDRPTHLTRVVRADEGKVTVGIDRAERRIRLAVFQHAIDIDQSRCVLARSCDMVPLAIVDRSYAGGRDTIPRRVSDKESRLMSGGVNVE